MTLEPLFILFTGLVFGSFVTLASYRLPLEEDIVLKPSRCPKCEAKLGFWDLWPVLSWLCARGKCRHCGAGVPKRYPLIEIATSALFLLVWSRYGLTFQGIVLALMGVVLLIMIVADLEHTIIPDEVHLALLPLGLGYHAAIGTPPEQVAGGFMVGMFIGLTLHHGYRIVRHKEGLGYGDVKFLAVAGLWLTPLPIVPFLFFSGLFGTLTGLLWRALGKDERFPFAPSLALALFVCLVFPEMPNAFWNMGQSLR